MQVGFSHGEWKVGSGRLLIVNIPARHGCRKVFLVKVYERTVAGRGDILDHIRNIGEWAVTQRRVVVEGTGSDRSIALAQWSMTSN